MSSLYSEGLQPPNLNPAEHLRDVVEQDSCDVQQTNLQQLCDGVTSVWRKTSVSRMFPVEVEVRESCRKNLINWAVGI